MAMVFAASGGDGETVHEILSVLATAQREVSPTRFHNSVHNAPSGYWAVATGSRAPSTSLCAFDDSFAAGMLEAAVQATVQDCPITLIAYDVPVSRTAARGASDRFVCSAWHWFWHRAGPIGRLAALTVAAADAESPATAMADPELERLRLGNPAARGSAFAGRHRARRRRHDPSRWDRYRGDPGVTLMLDRAAIAASDPA